MVKDKEFEKRFRDNLNLRNLEVPYFEYSIHNSDDYSVDVDITLKSRSVGDLDLRLALASFAADNYLRIKSSIYLKKKKVLRVKFIRAYLYEC